MRSRTFRTSFTSLVASGVLLGGLFATGNSLPATAAGPAPTPGPVLSSAAPCIPAGHGPKVIPSIAFGRQGGNIRPMKVSIYGDGTIAYAGGMPLSSSYTIPMDAVTGLQRLANAEGFWSMPTTITATRTLPDIANLYITIRGGCSTLTRTVTLRGNQTRAGAAFMELYDTLTAATALQR